MDVTYFWDEIENPMLFLPLGHTYDCKIGPQKSCPTIDFARAGQTIPILARDRSSDWKQTMLKGEICYINLPAVQIEQYLVEFGASPFQVEDLGLFTPPDPCFSPEVDGRQKTCADYSDSIACRNAGCDWVVEGRSSEGSCVPRE